MSEQLLDLAFNPELMLDSSDIDFDTGSADLWVPLQEANNSQCAPSRPQRHRADFELQLLLHTLFPESRPLSKTRLISL